MKAALVLLLGLSGCMTGMGDATPPPPQFAGHGHDAIVHYVSAEVIAAKCGRYPGYGIVGGCTYPYKNHCVIYILQGAPASVLPHERAHCNYKGRPGWQH